MPFTVQSRVNQPLSISLDESNSLHLGPHGFGEVEDTFRNATGIQIAIRSNRIRVVPAVNSAQIQAKAEDKKGDNK
jgi:hypothetical protein